MNWLLLIFSFFILAGFVAFIAYSFIPANPKKTQKPTKMENEREQFIAIISHQLRTPLSIVRGYLESLKSGDVGTLTPNQQEYVSEALEINENMGGLINGYLEAIAKNNQAITPQFAKINLNALLSKITDRFAGYAKASNIDLTIHLPAKQISISTDKRLLSNAVENIISNAMKYSLGSGRVVLTLESNERAAVITCEDAGIGIPEEQQKEIFTKFFRAKNTIHQNKIGSGLGLYVAKQYVDILGGTISFTSIERKGTTFTITIPTHSKGNI